MHRGQVARPEIGAMRHHADPERIGERDDLPDFADAADLGHARLRDIDRAMLEHRAEIREPRRVLTGGDRDPFLAQCGEQLVILRPPERLLDPCNVVAAHGPYFVDRLAQCPRAVGVDHQPGRGPDGLAREADEFGNDLMQLHILVAELDGAARVPRQRLRFTIAQQARIDGQLIAEAAAEQLVERHLRAFAGKVPECDVEAGKGVYDWPVAAEQMERLGEVAHQRVDARRVAPDQLRHDHPVEDHFGRRRDRVAETLAPADQTVLRLDAQHEDVEPGGRLPRDFPRAAADLVGDLQKHRLRLDDFHVRPLTPPERPRNGGG